MFKPARLVFRKLDRQGKLRQTARKQPQSSEQVRSAQETQRAGNLAKQRKLRLKFASQLTANKELLKIKTPKEMNRNQMKRLVFLAKQGNPTFQKKLRSLYEKQAGAGVSMIDESLKFASSVRYALKYRDFLGSQQVFKLNRKGSRKWALVKFNGSYYQRFSGSASNPRFYGSRVQLLRGDSRVYVRPGQKTAVKPKAAVAKKVVAKKTATKKAPTSQKKAIEAIKTANDLTATKARALATLAVKGNAQAKAKLRALYIVQKGGELHFNRRAKHIQLIMNRRGSFLAFFNKNTKLQGRAYGRGKWAEVRFNPAINDFDKYYPSRNRFRGKKYWPHPNDTLKYVSAPSNTNPKAQSQKPQRQPQGLKKKAAPKNTVTQKPKLTQAQEAQRAKIEKMRAQLKKQLEHLVFNANKDLKTMPKKHKHRILWGLTGLKLRDQYVDYNEKTGFKLNPAIMANPTRIFEVAQGLERVRHAIHYAKQAEKLLKGQVDFKQFAYKKMDAQQKKAYLKALSHVEEAKMEMVLGRTDNARKLLLGVIAAKGQLPRAKYIAQGLMDQLDTPTARKKRFDDAAGHLSDTTRHKDRYYNEWKHKLNGKKPTPEQLRIHGIKSKYFSVRTNFYRAKQLIARGDIGSAMRRLDYVIKAGRQIRHEHQHVLKVSLGWDVPTMIQEAIQEKRKFLYKTLDKTWGHIMSIYNNMKNSPLWKGKIQQVDSYMEREIAIYGSVRLALDMYPNLYSIEQIIPRLIPLYKKSAKKQWFGGLRMHAAIATHLQNGKSLVQVLLNHAKSNSQAAKQQALLGIARALGVQASATILSPQAARDTYSRVLKRQIDKAVGMVPQKTKDAIAQSYEGGKKRKALIKMVNDRLNKMVKEGKITRNEAKTMFPDMLNGAIATSIQVEIRDKAFADYVATGNKNVFKGATAAERKALAELGTLKWREWWGVGSKLAVELLFDTLTGRLILQGVAKAHRLGKVSQVAQNLMKMKGLKGLVLKGLFTLPGRAVVHTALGTKGKLGATIGAIKDLNRDRRVYLRGPKMVQPAIPSTQPPSTTTTEPSAKDRQNTWNKPTKKPATKPPQIRKKLKAKPAPVKKKEAPKKKAPSAAEKKRQLELQKKKWMREHMRNAQVMKFFVPPRADLKPWPKDVYKILKNLESQVHASLLSSLLGTEYFESRSNFYYRDHKIGRQYKNFARHGIDQNNPPRLSRIALSVDGLISFLQKTIKSYSAYPRYRRNAAGLRVLLKKVRAIRAQLRRYKYPTSANGLRALRGVARKVRYNDQYRFNRTQDVNSTGPRLNKRDLPDLETVTLKQLDKPMLNRILALAFNGHQGSVDALQRIFTTTKNGIVRFNFGWSRLGRYAYQKCRYRHIFGKNATLVVTRKKTGNTYRIKFDKNYRNGSYRYYDEKRKRFKWGRVALLRSDMVQVES